MNFEGKNVVLREISDEDTQQIVQWRNDPDLGAFLGGKPLTCEEHRSFLKAYFDWENDYYFVAQMKETKELIGTVAIYSVDLVGRNAEFGRLIIDPKYKLLAFEMSYMSLRFAFEELKLHKVYCQVQAPNTRALKFDYSLGFQQEGLLKEHFRSGESFNDVFFLSMFQENFSSLKRKMKMITGDG